MENGRKESFKHRKEWRQRTSMGFFQTMGQVRDTKGVQGQVTSLDHSKRNGKSRAGLTSERCVRGLCLSGLGNGVGGRSHIQGPDMPGPEAECREPSGPWQCSQQGSQDDLWSRKFKTRVSSWLDTGRLICSDVFHPLTPGCTVCTCKMNAFAPLSTEHVEGHGAPSMQRDSGSSGGRAEFTSSAPAPTVGCQRLGSHLSVRPFSSTPGLL